MDPLQIVFPIKVGIFHCYISVPEGIFDEMPIFPVLPLNSIPGSK